METKFTKGTWTIAVDEPITISINKHDHFCIPIVSEIGVCEEYAGTGVAILVWPVEDDSPAVREQIMATAHLIKAAPKLYEALHDFRVSLPDPEKDGSRTQTYWPSFARTIDDLLAEARGKQ